MGAHPLGLAPSRVGGEAVDAKLVQHAFGQDGASGIAGADKEHVEFVIRHDGSRERTWGKERRDASVSRHRLQQSHATVLSRAQASPWQQLSVR